MKRILGIALLGLVAVQCKTQIKLNKKTGPKPGVKTSQSVDLPNGTPAEQIQKVSAQYDQSQSCKDAPTTPSCVAANAIASTPVDTINSSLVDNPDVNVTVSVVGGQMNPPTPSVTTVTQVSTETQTVTQVVTQTQVITQTQVTTATATSTKLSNQAIVGISLLIGGTVIAVGGPAALVGWNKYQKAYNSYETIGEDTRRKPLKVKTSGNTSNLKFKAYTTARDALRSIIEDSTKGNSKKAILLGVIMGTVGAIVTGTGMNLADVDSSDSDLATYISQLGAIGAKFVH